MNEFAKESLSEEQCTSNVSAFLGNGGYKKLKYKILISLHKVMYYICICILCEETITFKLDSKFIK